MTPPRKPRNNARKKAARAVQRETGLRYKKSLAQIGAPAPARRGIIADGDSPMTASMGLICAQAAVDAAIKALQIPPPKTALAEDVPAWRKSLLITGPTECRHDGAQLVLLGVQSELDSWVQTVMAMGYVGVLPQRGTLRLELPDSPSSTSILDRQTVDTWLTKPLAAHDRSSMWAQALTEHLTELRRHLQPFHGAPVDEMRSVVDRLDRWLAGSPR